MNRIALACVIVFFGISNGAAFAEPLPPGTQLRNGTTLSKKSAVDTIPVTVAMELELNGAIVSKPKVIVLMGHKAEITEQEKGTVPSYSIEVFPSLASKPNSLRLSFVIKQKKDGRVTVLGRPQVVAFNGSIATISQESAGLPRLKLQVRPTF